MEKRRLKAWEVGPTSCLFLIVLPLINSPLRKLNKPGTMCMTRWNAVILQIAVHFHLKCFSPRPVAVLSLQMEWPVRSCWTPPASITPNKSRIITVSNINIVSILLERMSCLNILTRWAWSKKNSLHEKYINLKPHVMDLVLFGNQKCTYLCWKDLSFFNYFPAKEHKYLKNRYWGCSLQCFPVAFVKTVLIRQILKTFYT